MNILQLDFTKLSQFVKQTDIDLLLKTYRYSVHNLFAFPLNSFVEKLRPLMNWYDIEDLFITNIYGLLQI